MNKNDRKQVAEWIDQLEGVSSAIAEMEQDQEDKFDNLPEGIQNSERGDDMQNAIEVLQSAADSLEEALDSLRELSE